MPGDHKDKKKKKIEDIRVSKLKERLGKIGKGKRKIYKDEGRHGEGGQTSIENPEFYGEKTTGVFGQKQKKSKKYKTHAERDTEKHGEGLYEMMDRFGEIDKKKPKQKKAELTDVTKEHKQKQKKKDKLIHEARGTGVIPTYSKSKVKKTPPQGPNPNAETADDILKNAEVVSRKNDTYIGKLKQKIAEKRKKDLQRLEAEEEEEQARKHKHLIEFKGHTGQYYKRASLVSASGKYAKYWLLNAKQTNGNGWGVSQQSIAKNIHKFIGRPLVVTAKSWVPDSAYGDQFEHPYLPTNDINKVLDHQERYRVGSIVDIIEKDGDYFANIEINQKFANMILPPFCSPAIFQNNPAEPEGQISDWEALHLAALMEDPAYGSRIALLRGTCVGTKNECTVQFKSAKKEAKMVCTKGTRERLAKVRLAYRPPDDPELIEKIDSKQKKKGIRKIPTVRVKQPYHGYDEYTQPKPTESGYQSKGPRDLNDSEFYNKLYNKRAYDLPDLIPPHTRGDTLIENKTGLSTPNRTRQDMYRGWTPEYVNKYNLAKLKTRLARIKKKPIGTLPRGKGKDKTSELSERAMIRRMKEDFAKGKGIPRDDPEGYYEKKMMEPNRPDTEDPPAAMYMTEEYIKKHKLAKERLTRIKKNEKTSDQAIDDVIKDIKDPDLREDAETRHHHTRPKRLYNYNKKAKLKQRIAAIEQQKLAVSYKRKIDEVMKSFNTWEYKNEKTPKGLKKKDDRFEPLFTKHKGGIRGVRHLGNKFQYSGHYKGTGTTIPKGAKDKFIPHIIMEKTPKGIIVDNYGYDTGSTYRYWNKAGISTERKGDKMYVGGKPYDFEQGGKMLIPYKNITAPLAPKKRYVGPVRPRQHEMSQQTRLDATGDIKGVPEDPTRIQPRDQRLINKITGVKSKVPRRKILGTESHHLFEYNKYPQMDKLKNIGVGVSHRTHQEMMNPRKFTAKLKQRLSKLLDNKE